MTLRDAAFLAGTQCRHEHEPTSAYTPPMTWRTRVNTKSGSVDLLLDANYYEKEQNIDSA